MGCRVMKIQDENNWIVHQSTSGANFIPMFEWELSAMLFAEWFHRTRDLTSRFWSDVGQEELASTIYSFVDERYGPEPEKHPDYFVIVDDYDGRFRDVWEDFAEWNYSRVQRASA